MKPDAQIYYAHDAGGVLFNACPRAWWVRLHGSDEVVQVRLRERTHEDPPPPANGPDYWGWLAAGADEYSFVWPSRGQVEMCFPYGSAAESEAGQGRLVHLFAEPLSARPAPDPPRAPAQEGAGQVLRGGSGPLGGAAGAGPK